jgi:hypothetical protein
MKKNKVIGVLLLVLAVATVAGMVINKDAFWTIYNWTVIVLSVVGGIILLK